MGIYDQNLGWRVGPSSYGDLNGAMQHVSTEHVADQLNSLAFEFDELPANKAFGDRMSYNEAIRSDDRQYLLWNEWETYLKNGHPVASLAAKPLTSTHRLQIGTAVDIGITRADGSYRVPTAAEWAWIHAQAEKRGIRWTGKDFVPQEVWHHNGGYAETLPPYPNVRIANTPIASVPAAVPAPNSDWLDMALRIVNHPKDEKGVTPGVTGGVYLHNIENGKSVYVGNADDLGKLKTLIYGSDGSSGAPQIYQQEADVMTARYIAKVA